MYSQGAKDLSSVDDEHRLFDSLGDSDQSLVQRLWAVLAPRGVSRVYASRLLSLLQVWLWVLFLGCRGEMRRPVTTCRLSGV
jgi:hypothetical protein